MPNKCKKLYHYKTVTDLARLRGLSISFLRNKAHLYAMYWETTTKGRILNEEGLGTSYMARKAAKQLLQKTGVNPDEIDAVVVCTSTPDYHFPSTASILCDKLGLKNAYAFDLQAACCGFLFGMEVVT